MIPDNQHYMIQDQMTPHNQQYMIQGQMTPDNHHDMYLESLESWNQRTKKPLSLHRTVTLVINGINWKFLSIAIKSMKAIPQQENPKEDNILKKVLSQDLQKLLLTVDHSCVDTKRLRHDCPLTPALFSLCLKYMEDDISRVIPNVTTRISY
ncbi:unnamed protein product [Coregonus sp. 'balchen']|nr:unnamed protein product [Coregonus sp. 'balchen']